jgi:hypothetical protein
MERFRGAALPIIVSIIAAGAVVWRNDAVNQAKIDAIFLRVQNLQEKIVELEIKVTRLEVRIEAEERHSRVAER